MRLIYQSEFLGFKEINHKVFIYDREQSAGGTPTDLILETPGYSISWDAGISDTIETGIIQSEAKLFIRNKNQILDTLLAGLVGQENRYLLEIQRDDVVYWRGVFLCDFAGLEDLPEGQITLSATDGIGILNDIPYPDRGVLTPSPNTTSFIATIAVAMGYNPVTELYGGTPYGDNDIMFLAKTNWRTAYMDVNKEPLYAAMPIHANLDESIWVRKGQKEGYDGSIISYTEPMSCREVIQHILTRFNAVMLMTDGKWCIYQRDILAEGENVLLAMFNTLGYQYEGHYTNKSTQIEVLTANDIHRAGGTFNYLQGLKQVDCTYLPFFIGNAGDSESLIPAEITDFTAGNYVETRPLASGTGNYIHLGLDNVSVWHIGHIAAGHVIIYAVVKQGDYWLKADGSWGVEHAVSTITIFQKTYIGGLMPGYLERYERTEVSWELITQALPCDEKVEVRFFYGVSTGITLYGTNPHIPKLYYIYNNENPISYTKYTALNTANEDFTMKKELEDSLFGSNHSPQSKGMIWTWIDDVDQVCQCINEDEKLWQSGSGARDRYFNQVLVDEVLGSQLTALLMYSGNIISRDVNTFVSPFTLYKIVYKGANYLMTINKVEYNPIQEQLSGDFVEVNKELIYTATGDISTCDITTDLLIPSIIPSIDDIPNVNLINQLIPHRPPIDDYGVVNPDNYPFIPPPPTVSGANINIPITIEKFPPPGTLDPGASGFVLDLNGMYSLATVQNNKWHLRTCSLGSKPTITNGNLYNWYALFADGTLYNDWFLPSLQELGGMYSVLKAQGVGDFLNEEYWTSSEFGVIPAERAACAYWIDFATGFPVSSSLNCFKFAVTANVRPCRTFISATEYDLRDTGEAGGLIFSKVDNGDGTYTYKESGLVDLTPATWSNIINLEAGTDNTDGETNTAAIIAQVGHTSSCALQCTQYTTTSSIVNRTVTGSTFRIPAIADITTLTNYIEGLSKTMSALKDTSADYWNTPNTDAEDLFGFAIKGGGKRNTDGTFEGIKDICRIHTSEARSVEFQHDSSDIVISAEADKDEGCYVRLVRDASVAEQLLDDGTEVASYVGTNLVSYTCIKIGTQVWTAENLIETIYLTKELITPAKIYEHWSISSTEGYACQYENDRNNAVIIEDDTQSGGGAGTIVVDEDVFEGDGSETTPLSMKNLDDDVNYGIKNGKYSAISRNIDGGTSSSIYLPTQKINGGTA